MANVEKERVVTEFKLTLNPTEYRLIMDSLSTHLEELQNALEKNSSFDSTEFQEETISEMKQLKKQLESEYSSEWINE